MSAAGKPRQARQKGKKDKSDPLASLKEEIARELGLWPAVEAGGWGSLSAAQTGRIGGLLYHRSRAGRSPRSQDEQNDVIDHQQDEPQGDPQAGPLAAPDAQFSRRDDVGNVAGD